MFEMFFTALVTVGIALYGFSQSVFMSGPHVFYYRAALFTVILLILLVQIYRHWSRHLNLVKLKVDIEEYMYYEKFTSILYRAGYYISYLIQNILFDYIYMRRNFNFCKGLDVYDGGVGEYYIKFRNTWYRYLKLTNLRHKVSIRKLQSYAAQTKNEMILKAMDTDEEREICKNFAKAVDEVFLEKHVMGDYLMMKLPDYDKVPLYFRKNLIRLYQNRIYLDEYEPVVIHMVDFLNQHAQRDVNDYKKTIYR